jgi:PAS domain S-box-containing protein
LLNDKTMESATLASGNDCRADACSGAEVLAGGGEMGTLMRAFDWAASPLGPVESWSQSLRSAVDICLHCSFTIAVCWGQELSLLYNDSYRPILGNKHPAALGRPLHEVFPEIWHVIGPMFQQVLDTGQAAGGEDFLLLLERHGYLEESYFNFSYSPIRDETGRVCGVFVPVAETTEKVIGERRLRTLRDLAAGSSEAKEEDESCRVAAATLAANPSDLPFALLYLLDEHRSQARLVGAAGIAEGTPPAPQIVPLREESQGGWPLAQVARTGRARLVEDLAQRFGSLPSGAWPVPPHTALILPVALPGQALPSALLVAAINPHKALNEDYRIFLRLVSQQVAASLAEARALEEERKRALDEITARQQLEESQRRAQEVLENRVQERTAELIAANVALQAEIVQRRRAEEALKENEERYRQMFENNHAVKLLLDPTSGAIVDANPAAAEFYGYSLAELRRMTIAQINLLPAEQVAAEMSRAASAQRTYFLFRHRLASGEVRDVEVYSSPFVFKGQRLLYSIVHDITERRQAETALRALNADLEQRVAERTAELQRSNDELQQFAYIVSHDLTEPLRTVASYVQLLAKRAQGTLDAEMQEFIGFAVDGARRMQQLIQDLLAYTRAAGTEQEFGAVDGEVVLARVLGDLQVAITDSGAEVTHDPLPTLHGDAKQIGLVFQNLIGNALKFRSTAPPHIHVSARREGARWLLSVRDNGIGIAPRHAEQIFQVFQRLHPRSEYSGTGIGLAICKKIIERHGGRIWVESTPGNGATFFFTLPPRSCEHVYLPSLTTPLAGTGDSVSS